MLRQSNSLALTVDVNDIASMYHVSADTVPPKPLNSTLDWAYGQIREVFAVSQYTTSMVQNYCVNRVGDVYSALITDPACIDSALPYPEGYPNYFTPLDSALQILASYGISGDITVPSLDQYQRQVSVSLLNPEGGLSAGPAIRYCSPLPPTFSLSVGVATGVDFLRFLSEYNDTCPPGVSIPARRRAYGFMSGNEHNSREVLTFSVNSSATPRRRALWRGPGATLETEDRDINNAPLASAGLRNRGSLRSLLNSTVSSPAPINTNPLDLSLADAAVDDLGFWKCYKGSSNTSLNPTCWDPDAQYVYNSFNTSDHYGYPQTVFAAVDIHYTVIEEVSSLPNLKLLVQAWQVDGAAAPVLADAGLSMRFSVDGTAGHLDEPDCKGIFNAPAGVKALEYSFKTRLRLWDSEVDQIRVWLCCLTCTDSVPRNVSLLNITDQLSAMGYPPLGPGPFVKFVVPLKAQMDTATVTTLQERLCTAVWSTVDERCQSRAWALFGRRSTTSWQVSLWFLTYSNSRAARTSYLLANDISQPDVPGLFPQIDFSLGAPIGVVNAPWPNPKINRNMLVGCVSHYDCADGEFCSTGALQASAAGFQGGGGPGPTNFACDLCRYCLSDSNEPNDRYCPRDKCGVKSGSFPSCLDAKKLFSNFTCQSIYNLNMSRIPVTEKVTTWADPIPLSDPNSTARKARFLTPYNQLVGGLVISQQRRQTGCTLRNDSVGRYAATKLISLGAICVNDKVSSDPYGVDPAFTSSSSLYEGYIDQTQFYTQSETGSSGAPHGFFPHSYDGETHRAKNPAFIMTGEGSTFKAFFTERVSSKEAQRLVTYLRDGGFLDAQTSQVIVEAVTFNANLDIFGIYTFTFTWQVCRDIKCFQDINCQ